MLATPDTNPRPNPLPRPNPHARPNPHPHPNAHPNPHPHPNPEQLSPDIVAVAVTPPLATGLDVLKMPTRMFQATPTPTPTLATLVTRTLPLAPYSRP